MTDINNMFSKSLNADLGGQLIDKGDVALLLKSDGSVRALTFGCDTSRIAESGAELTEEDQRMLEQGRKLFALAFAAGHPKLMQVLLNIAADPDVVDFSTLSATTVRH